jgi:nucleoside-diphosphate-sugar epimerase
MLPQRRPFAGWAGTTCVVTGGLGFIGSNLVRALVESSVSADTFLDSREVELKGLAGSHTIYAVRL